MAKDVPHYTQTGAKHRGAYHKMPDGSLHSGKKHTKASKPLFHMADLPEEVQSKIKQRGMKFE
jgi:hypothetical protein